MFCELTGRPALGWALTLLLCVLGVVALDRWRIASSAPLAADGSRTRRRRPRSGTRRSPTHGRRSTRDADARGRARLTRPYADAGRPRCAASRRPRPATRHCRKATVSRRTVAEIARHGLPSPRVARSRHDERGRPRHGSGSPTSSGTSRARRRPAWPPAGSAPSGVVVPVIDRWFYVKALGGVDAELRRAGYDLVLYNLGGPGRRPRPGVPTLDAAAPRRRARPALAGARRRPSGPSSNSAGTRSIVIGGPAPGLRNVGRRRPRGRPDRGRAPARPRPPADRLRRRAGRGRHERRRAAPAAGRVPRRRAAVGYRPYRNGGRSTAGSRSPAGPPPGPCCSPSPRRSDPRRCSAPRTRWRSASCSPHAGSASRSRRTCP